MKAKEVFKQGDVIVPKAKNWQWWDFGVVAKHPDSIGPFIWNVCPNGYVTAQSQVLLRSKTHRLATRKEKVEILSRMRRAPFENPQDARTQRRLARLVLQPVLEPIYVAEVPPDSEPKPIDPTVASYGFKPKDKVWVYMEHRKCWVKGIVVRVFDGIFVRCSKDVVSELYKGRGTWIRGDTANAQPRFVI